MEQVACNWNGIIEQKCFERTMVWSNDIAWNRGLPICATVYD